MGKLSSRASLLTESQTLFMSKKSRELKQKGIDVINLSLGEPDFNTPQHIKDAGKKAIDDNFSYYPPVAGFLDLREAISKKFKKENNLDYAADQIVVSTGAKQSITNLILALIDKGDEVILPSPYWVSYIEVIKLAEGVPVIIPTEINTNFKVTPEQLRKAITPKTKMLVYSSPCNPTGTVYTKEELSALAEVLAKHEHVYILSDEIYEHITFNGKHETIAQFDAIKDRVAIVNGVSKSFAMTGWRIGYIGAPKWMADACEKMQGQITSGACSIAQRAALEALTTDIGPTLKMKEAFQKRRDMLVKLMREIPGVITNVPDGAFYLFPDVSSYFGKSDGTTVISDAAALSMYLLDKAHVSLVTGGAFGDPRCIRISYATSEKNLQEAMRRIKEALALLK